MGAAFDTGLVEPEVKIKQTRLTPYTLPLRRQWNSSRQNFTSRSGWLLELEDSNRITGYGDCAPLPYHGTESETIAQSTLERMLPLLIGLTPEQGLDVIADLGQSPAARCALETALLDLIAKSEGVPLHKWLNQESGSKVRVNANIGALGIASIERAFDAIDKGYSILKLKVGISEPEHELKLLTQLCRNLPKSVQLRLDANRAWDLETARTYLKAICHLPIESLEEPLAKSDIETLINLQGETGTIIALDETISDLAKKNQTPYPPIRRIILKPMILGGLLPSLQLGQCARQLGIEVVVTTTVDSAAGVWAASQLAAALDTDGKLCHGLGTGEWLQKDIGNGQDIRNGMITLPATPGLGFAPYT